VTLGYAVFITRAYSSTVLMRNSTPDCLYGRPLQASGTLVVPWQERDGER
jgi:hypothetical protein